MHAQTEGVRINGFQTAFILLEIINLIYISGEKNPEVSIWLRLYIIQNSLLIVSVKYLWGNIFVTLKNWLCKAMFLRSRRLFKLFHSSVYAIKI